MATIDIEGLKKAFQRILDGCCPKCGWKHRLTVEEETLIKQALENRKKV